MLTNWPGTVNRQADIIKPPVRNVNTFRGFLFCISLTLEKVSIEFLNFNFISMNENLFQQIKLVFALLFALLLVVFAVQNAQEVEIRFWVWQFSASLSLVLLISIGIGVMLSILFTTFAIRKKNIKKKAEEAEKKLESQKIENTEDI